MRIVSSLLIIIFFAAAHPLSADPCVDCHKNPKYKKEDITRLKECLQCHGMAGHPYKETIGLGGVDIAEAGEKKDAIKTAEKKSPNLQDMVLIPEGEFLMGTDDRLRDEKPLHTAYIDSFYIDRYEVTNAYYKRFVDSTGHPAPDNWEGGNYPKDKGSHPVIYVSWHDADKYCRWIGKRLLREAEWEKAARGVDGRIYPWGNKWDLNKSNNPIRGHEGTMPIGSFPEGKSPYGLYDMSGNVWEWVDDWYLAHSGSDYASPEFSEKSYRILKGGSWWDCMFYGCGISAPTYNRSFFDPTTKNDSFGFRCGADASIKSP